MISEYQRSWRARKPTNKNILSIAAIWRKTATQDGRITRAIQQYEYSGEEKPKYMQPTVRISDIWPNNKMPQPFNRVLEGGGIQIQLKGHPYDAEET